MATESEVWDAINSSKGDSTPKGAIIKASTPASKRFGKMKYKEKGGER